MKKLLLFGLLAASLPTLGCKSAGETKPGQETAALAADYKPTGEIVFAQEGVSLGSTFSADRVAGPRIDMSPRGDGSWAGTLQNGVVDVSVYPNRLSGVDLKLTQEITPSGVIITGQYQGRIFRFEVSSNQFLVRTPTRSFTLPKTGEGLYGEGGIVKLTGEAASANPPWPQFALALVGAF